MAAAAIYQPARNLLGVRLASGWEVFEMLQRSPEQTGGHFSTGYLVRSRAAVGYMKAMDLSSAFQHHDPARRIKAMMESFVFESDLLEQCKARKLSRVVPAIEAGNLGSSPNDHVFYLIFPLADGDIRSQLREANLIDIQWTLTALHQIALGVHQLHGNGIAHQDLKPSNVLSFALDGCKLADLGRASAVGHNPPHECLDVPGDKSYAPPELLYGFKSEDWLLRRIGGDLYLLGSMIVWLFVGSGMTPLIFTNMDKGFWPQSLGGQWGGTYIDVLPHIHNAFGRAVTELRPSFPSELRDELVSMIIQLCQPDPLLRGHPSNLKQVHNRLSVERYISRLSFLAQKAGTRGFVS